MSGSPMDAHPPVAEPVVARPGERLAGSWRIGDARPGGDSASWAHDLMHLVHVAASEYFGAPRQCGWSFYTAGESEFGLADFVDELHTLGASAGEIATALSEWRSCSRPIAVVHVSAIWITQ